MASTKVANAFIPELYDAVVGDEDNKIQFCAQ